MTVPRLDYSAVPTLDRFRRSDAGVRLVMGPFGSGKSTACVRELVLRSLAQEPSVRDGIRRSRWLVVRNTYRELQDTTRATFDREITKIEEDSGVRFCTWREADMAATFRLRDLHAEILFRALDTPSDASKILSLEITGAWINEAREVGLPVFELIKGRIPRYPSMSDGGPTWYGLWMDTNPCDTDHWLYRLFEEERPAGWELFRQPGGRDPGAENLPNLHPDYYDVISQGMRQEWVDVYVHGKYGFVSSDRPVYPEYSDALHTQEFDVPRNTQEILVGMDFGLTPAAVMAVRDPVDSQVRVFDEFVARELGAVTFARELARKLRSEYPAATVSGWGDPAGEQRSQTDERTAYEVLAAAGLPLSPAPTNDWTRRREAVGVMLRELTMRARPRIIIHPRCRVLRKAQAGGYCLQRIQISGPTERFRDAPVKDQFSHVAEALQYLAVGLGEDRAALHGAGPPRRVKAPFRTRSALGR